MGRGKGTVEVSRSGQRPGAVEQADTSEAVHLRRAVGDEVVYNWDGRSFTPDTGPRNLTVDPTYLNAYLGDRLVGTIMFRNFRVRKGDYGAPGSQSLESVYVLPECRKQGLFLLLWAAMRKTAPKLRVTGDWKNKRLQQWVIAQRLDLL